MEVGLPQNLRSLEDFNTRTAVERDSEEELGRTAFLELMIAQIENQDPLEPAQNEAFIAQLAQFSSVEGIQNLNESMDSLVASLRGNVALEAGNLVGRNVLIPTNQTALNTQGGVGGTVEIDANVPNLFVDILNAQGQTVKRLEMGAAPAGQIRFNWDGLSEGGEPVEQGFYRVEAYSEIEGNRVDFQALLPDQIVSVSIEEGGLIANLAGGSSVPAAQIREIR